MKACYLGYIGSAIINNYAPLLFLTFQSSFGISLDKITLLVTMNFGIQLIVDLLSAKFVDRIGYRISIVAAQLFSCLSAHNIDVLLITTSETKILLCIEEKNTIAATSAIADAFSL